MYSNTGVGIICNKNTDIVEGHMDDIDNIDNIDDETEDALMDIGVFQGYSIGDNQKKDVFFVLDDMCKYYMLFTLREKEALGHIKNNYDYQEGLILAKEMTNSKPYFRIMPKFELLADLLDDLYSLCDKEDAIRRIIGGHIKSNQEMIQKFQIELDGVYAEKIAILDDLLAEESFHRNFIEMYAHDSRKSFINSEKLLALFDKVRSGKDQITKDDVSGIFWNWRRFCKFMSFIFPRKKIGLKDPYYDLLRELLDLLKAINCIDPPKRPGLIDRLRARRHGKGYVPILS